jgi:hypothetical protein
MTDSATASPNQARTWPAVESGPLIAGGILIGLGSVLALAGLAIAGTHIAVATRRWVNDMDVPPSQLARLRWEQARDAAAAGANSWRDHPNAKVGAFGSARSRAG